VIVPSASASCVPLTEKERVRVSDAVFTARVLSVGASGARATFRVLKMRKGRLTRGDTIRVRAEPFPSSITFGWNPKAGQRWRVYAQRGRGRWHTNDCLGTRRS
jgi:hypothetical protein